MKQTKKNSVFLCSFLLFSALAFGKVTDIQGRWTSIPPTFRHGNMFVYISPVTELDFISSGFLFIDRKNGYEGTVSLYAYSYDGEELILGDRYYNQLQYGEGTVSIEERKALNIRGFDDALLSNGTYYYLGESYM